MVLVVHTRIKIFMKKNLNIRIITLIQILTALSAHNNYFSRIPKTPTSSRLILSILRTKVP